MPLSEFLRLASGKHESDQQRPNTYPTDLSSLPENDFLELVWDNGQITMQGQSSRVRKSQSDNDTAIHMPGTRDKYLGNATSSRVGKAGLMESLLDDASPAVPSGDMDLSQDDDLVPWLNYPMDELLPEVSGVTMNERSNHNGLALVNKRSSIQGIGSSRNIPMHNSASLNGTEVGSSKTGLMSSWSSQQGQSAVPSLGSGASDIVSCNTWTNRSAAYGDSIQGQPSASGYHGTKMQKQDINMPVSSSNLPNFPFLARHTALVRSSLHSTAPMSGSSAMDTIPLTEKSSAARGSHFPSSTLRKETAFNQPLPDSGTIVSRPSGSRPPEQSHSAKQSNELRQDDAEKTDASTCQVIGADQNKGILDVEKTIEPVVGSSSVCSGSSADRASNDRTYNLKRKGRDNEDLEYRSEDIEEESVGAKKAAAARGGTGSKRSRAAEVHNLSERRRRDRINEKMRALQELIPNCNKVDKASMLDEAIEYLKTLQLQVQIMSMGAGMCMPQMMFPAGMQHLHPAHMPHFPPMGVGMGMGMGVGMGYGMGMLDMNGGAPIFPVPPMQRPHFPSPSVSGPSNFPGLAGPNVPVIGHPGQGRPMLVPRAPLVPLPGPAPSSLSVGMGAAIMGYHGEAPSASSTLNTKDPLQDKSTQLMANADIRSSMNQASSELHSTNEGFDHPNQSALLPKNDQVPNVSGDADANLADGNDVLGRKAGCD